MSQKTIKELVATCINGQGNQVDLGSVLGTILENVSTKLEMNDYTEFSEEITYQEGEIVRYDGKLYIFTEKHLYGEWDGNDVRSITMADVVGGIKITHDALKYKRDNSLLKVGEKYRITDYVATTFQPYTRSAEHPFDIIVEVISENALSENATAIQHEGDTYFAESHLEAWEIKYSIDNDVLRFAWAVNQIQLAENELYVRTPQFDTDGHWAWVYYDTTEESFYTDDRAYTDPNPIIGGTLYMGEGAEATSVDSIIGVNQGKGVIYHMVDEYNNECPYDFKGIRFLRSEDWCNEHTEFTENVLNDEYQDYWLYTFSLFDENREILDASIVGNSGQYLNDEGKISGVYSNKIGECSAYSGWYESFSVYALPTSVFVNWLEDVFFYGCYGNTLLSECYENTFGNNVRYNTFGNYCYNNTFGNNCYNNTFGNECSSNTFGNYVRRLSVFEGVAYCAVTDGSSFNSYVQNAQILNGTRGTNDNRLTITFQENLYVTQVAGLNSGGTLTIWKPADDQH